MHPHFVQVIEILPPTFEGLLAMAPVKSVSLPRRMPASGVYLFTERGAHLYVGRSNRLRDRIRRHGAVNSRQNVAAFAFKIARQETRQTEATYRTEGSRKQLAEDPAFAEAFLAAKARIREMNVRFVEETNQLRQAILEIYAAVVLETPFNDFDTH